MTIREKPPVDDDALDRDDPIMRATVNRMLILMAGQLEATAEDLMARTLTPWASLRLQRRMDKIREEIGFLRKDVSRLKPVGEE